MCSIPCFKFQSANIFSDIEHIPNRSRKRIGTHRETYVTGIGPLDSDQFEIELQKQVTQLQRVQELKQSNLAHYQCRHFSIRLLQW